MKQPRNNTLCHFQTQHHKYYATRQHKNNYTTTHTSRQQEKRLDYKHSISYIQALDITHSTATNSSPNNTIK